MKKIKYFGDFTKVTENWGATHQPNSIGVEPNGYNVGDTYFYVNQNTEPGTHGYNPKENPEYVIKYIKNGEVHAVSSDGVNQDNPSVSELNDNIESGEVKLK